MIASVEESMYDRILVPTDGTEDARAGIEHAVELAAAVGATIHALYVIKLPDGPETARNSGDDDAVEKEYRAYGEQVTTTVCETAKKANVDCVCAIRTGAIHEEVVEYAADEAIDLIVMGTGYRGRYGSIMGGTAEKIVRTAEIPVTTVRT